MNPTTTAEQWWSSKDYSGFYSTWELGQARSEWLVEQLSLVQFNSAFEVGCNSGRNLQAIQQAFPTVEVGGLDISAKSIQTAQHNIPAGSFYHLKADELEQVPGDWDCVFTMGTMIHLTPEVLTATCKQLVEKAKRVVIHVEYNGSGKVINAPKQLNPAKKVSNKFRWEPDLLGAYKLMGLTPKLTPLPKHLASTDCNSFIVVEVSK